MKAGDLKVTFDGLKKFDEAMKALSINAVLVGVPSTKKERQDDEEDDGINNAAIGYINEHGSELMNIPPRPHLSVGIELVQDEVAEEFKKAAQKAFSDPKAIEKHYSRAGMIASNSVKAVIVSQMEFTPLSDRTIAMRKSHGFKGESALIVTGQYRNSITYVLEKAGQ